MHRLGIGSVVNIDGVAYRVANFIPRRSPSGDLLIPNVKLYPVDGNGGGIVLPGITFEEHLN
jgi:hypothetical protein